MFSKILIYFMIFQMVLFSTPASVYAQEAAGSTGVNADLASSQKTMSTTSISSFSPVDIHLGGDVVAVGAGQLLTPAEYIAVMQMLSGGQQNIILNNAGVAVGGSFNIQADLAGHQLAALMVPQGVTAVNDFGLNQNLNLLGNLTNAGNLYAISSVASVTQANILASNIFNQPGALLTSVLPANGLLSYLNLVNNLSLNLTAVNDIVNQGIISSAANLNVIAGGSIINTMTGTTAPIMQAMNNLNLLAMSGQVVNSGVLSSIQNSVNISTLMNRDLLVNNSGGQIQALLGSVNIRDMMFAGKQNSIISGGDVLSKELNVFSGNGVANINVQEVSGLVNAVAGELHMTTESSILSLGKLCLSGDPTFYNTNGDIVINNDLVFDNAPLALVASGNILSGSGAGRIETNGGDILMVAGADFTVDDPSTITIHGGSSEGGKIDLSVGTPIVSLSTSKTSEDGIGGNLTLVAFAGDNSTTGAIIVPDTVAIATGGKGVSANGSVSIYASAPSGIGVNIGSVDTSGAEAYSDYGGAVTIANADAQLSSGGVSIQDGQIVQGEFYLDQSLARQGAIQVGDINAIGQGDGEFGPDVTIVGGGNVKLASIITSTPVDDNGNASGGYINIQGGLSGQGDIDLSGATLNVSGIGEGNGGCVDIYQNSTDGKILLTGSQLYAEQGVDGYSPGQIYLTTLGENGVIDFSNGGLIQGDMLQISTSNLSSDQSSTISCNYPSSFITIVSNGNLTLSGGATINISPDGELTISASGNNSQLLFDGRYTLNGSYYSYIYFSSDDEGGQIKFADNSSLVIPEANWLQVVSPNVIFGADSSILAYANSDEQYLEFYTNNPVLQNVVLPSGSQTTIRADKGGYAYFGPLASGGIQFTTSGGGSSQLNIENAIFETYSDGLNTTIDSGVTISSNYEVRLYSEAANDTMYLNGKIITSGDSIRFYSYTKNLTLAGNPQEIKVTSDNGLIELFSNRDIIFNSNYQFDAGANGVLSFRAENVQIADNKTVSATGGSEVSVLASGLYMGNGSQLSSSKVDGNAFEIRGLTELKFGGNASLVSAGGRISISTNDLNIEPLAVSPTPQNFQFLGGTLDIEITDGGLTSATNTNLISDSNINIQGLNQLDLGGSLKSTANSGSISVAGDNLILSGNDLSRIEVTGSGDNNIEITGSGQGLLVDNSYTISAGSGGQVSLNATTGSVNLVAGKTIYVDGSPLLINTNQLIMQDGSSIVSDISEGTAVLTQAYPLSNLEVLGDSGGIVAFVTAGGKVEFQAPGEIKFAKLGGVGEPTEFDFINANYVLNSTSGQVDLTDSILKEIIQPKPIPQAANILVSAPPANQTAVVNSSVQPIVDMIQAGYDSLPKTNYFFRINPEQLKKKEKKADEVVAYDSQNQDMYANASFVILPKNNNIGHIESGVAVGAIANTGDNDQCIACHMRRLTNVSYTPSEEQDLVLVPTNYLQSGVSVFQNTNSGAVQMKTHGGELPVKGTVNSMRSQDWFVAYMPQAHINFGSDRDSLILKKGEILIKAMTNLHVLAAGRSIELKPGVIALIQADKHALTVRNMCESKQHSVKLQLDDKTISLASGEELVIAAQDDHLKESFTNDQVGRRHCKKYALSAGKHACHSEVSLVSVMQKSPLFQRLLSSSNTYDQFVRETIIKMAACLMVVTQYRGAYKAAN